MHLAANPLVPAGYDIVWSLVSLVVLALLVWALVSIARHGKTLTSGQALVWTLLVIFVPVLGPLAWLFIGRRAGASAVERAQ